MSEISESTASPPEPGNERYMAVMGSRRRSERQARVTEPRPLEQVGRFAGSLGSALTIIGFALPIGSGWYQVDGYEIFLLLRGNWADTSQRLGVWGGS
jgi:hypothetical protein